MPIEQILSFAKTLLINHTTLGDCAIDATVGNGNDTLFLSNLVGESGIVFGFDIQELAIQNTKALLTQHQKTNVVLFYQGHETLKTAIPEKYHQNISSAMFNLGYLPTGDKSITTKPETTLTAIKELLEILKVNGIIIVCVYYGHKGGKEEMNQLISYLSLLNQKDYQVLQYRFLNQINDAPFLLAIEKIK